MNPQRSLFFLSCHCPVFSTDDLDTILFTDSSEAYNKAFAIHGRMLTMLLQEDEANRIDVTNWLKVVPMELANFQAVLEQYLLSLVPVVVVGPCW